MSDKVLLLGQTLCFASDPFLGPIETCFEHNSRGGVLLQNGLVLAAGGVYANGPVKSSELYDPDTATWSATGPLAGTHNLAAWVLLADGTVLANGGYQSTICERYDPSSGAWHLTNSSVLHPFYSATLLASGEVLLSGGNVGGECELYNPITEIWKSTSPLPQRRVLHTATLLPTGHVLFVGGHVLDKSAPLNTCLLYNPATGTWSPAPSFLHPRQAHTATLLKNGKLLLVGGLDEKNTPTNSVEVYEVEP